MLKSCNVAGMFSVAVMILAGNTVCAQDYPNKPVRIVASSAGGAGDFITRLIAGGLTNGLGQQVIIDNRGGLRSQEAVKTAQPDGYTLLYQSSALWVLAILEATHYDPLKDYVPISTVARSPNILSVHPSVPAKTVKELIAHAKANPGQLNYASGSTGSPPHVAAEMFRAMADLDIVRIGYKASANRFADLVSGRVQIEFGNAASLTRYIKLGQMRALAVTSAQPSPLMPDLPTIAASGLPGYESVGMTGIYAPLKTPVAVINRLNQELVKVLSQAEVKDKLLEVGVESSSCSPMQFVAIMKADMSRMAKLVKMVGDMRVNY